MRLLLTTVLLVLSCSGTQTTKPVASGSSGAQVPTIAVEVAQQTTFAGRFASDLAGKLREELLAASAGVPVTDASKADLILRVTITQANFSNATNWEWQLVHVETGAIVSAKTEQANLGRNAGPLARDIVGAVSAFDLSGYASDSTVAAARVAEAPAQVGFPTSKTDGANAWAVVIGIENYREELPAVSGARADAESFAAYARQTLNVPEANIRLLLGERASRADITGVLTEWLPRNATTANGRVYVFFSGHGGPDPDSGEAYLLPYDANPTYIKSSGFAVDGLQRQLATLSGQQAFVFLDACFSGTGERSVLAKGIRPLVPVKELAVAAGVVTFAAAGARETAGATANGSHGLFTHHLMAGLSGGADANADGQVSVSELHGYVVEHVSGDARRENRDQTPTLAAASGAAERVVVRGLSP